MNGAFFHDIHAMGVGEIIRNEKGELIAAITYKQNPKKTFHMAMPIFYVTYV